MPLVTRALKVLSEREVSPQLGLLKSTLLQLDSTFSERTYGAGSFRDFVQKLEKVGVVKVHHGRGGLLVELADTKPHAGGKEAGQSRTVKPPRPPTRRSANDDGNRAGESPAARVDCRTPAIGTAAEGLREFRRILSQRRDSQVAAVSQEREAGRLVRPTPSFDERAYGFGNLTDLLRAAHREGIVRVDRDRQGVIRVFQGSPTTAPGAPDAAEIVESTPETLPDEAAVAAAAAEIGVPILPVDSGLDASQPADAESDEAAPPLPETQRKRRQRTPRAAGARPRRTKKTA